MKAVLVTILGLATAMAQTALTGGIQGTLQSETGPAANTTVTLRSESLAFEATASTSPTGEFRFLRLAPAADYVLRAAGLERADLRVVSGEVLDVPLVARTGTDSVTVTDQAARAQSSEVDTTVSIKQLTELPTNGRFLNRFALLDAHVRNTGGLGGDGTALTRLSVNGQIFRDTQYRLDGNTNYDTLFNNAPLQRLSISAVQEYRVLTNQFNAEHGSTSTGLVIATTRSGTDEFHGEGLFYGRPSGIQARPPLANRHVPNQLTQFGASLGGPIVRGRAYFFGNFERLNQDRGSFISSPAPDLFVGEYRDTLALARLDFRASDKNWLSLRVNGQRETNNNANDRVGGLIQASAANKSLGQSVGSQLTGTNVFGNFVNELRAGYTNAVPSNTIPLSPQTSVVRPGVSTDGAFSFSMIRTEVYQLADQLSWNQGSHTIKMGGDFIRRKVRDFAYDQFGTYTFAGGVPAQFTQRFGINLLTYGQTQWSGFIQDSWRVLPRLTLNYGLRYDYQSIIDDYNNIGPRFGLAWDVRGDGKTIVRAGGGVSYDQPFFHGLTQRFLQNGPDAPFRSFTLVPGQAGFPVFPASFAPTAPPAGLALAPRNLAIRGDELRSPYTSQFTIAFERKLIDGWVLSLTGIRSFGVKQFIQFNRNAPAPFVRTAPGQVRTVAQADATRPLTSYQGVAIRDLRQTENGGVNYYHAFDVRLSRQFAKRYTVNLHHVWSSAINTVTDDHLGANPNEWSDVVRGERALSDFAQRHRFVANGIVALPKGFQLSAFTVLASGLPVNALTGVDNNGDTTVVDRPAGFGRNAFRGRPQRSLDLSLLKNVRLSERVRMDLRADMFNVFNNQNFHSFNRVYGNGASPNASFLAPIGGVANADPGRQFTFGAKLVY
ncbi:MAG: TonB-dependent receptor [Bryobacteraceae bacterium]|nr:TonB-dependent receptor [Bryobacteraceae bacterium]